MIAMKTATRQADAKRIANLVTSTDQNFILLTEDEFEKYELLRRKEAGEALEATLESTRKQSVVNGTANITMDEINAEIAAYRQEQQR